MNVSKRLALPFVLATSIAATCAASPASARPVCLPYDDAVSSLTEDYKEQAVFQAPDARGHVVELWFNPSTQTWTLLTIMPNKTACVIGAGDYGQMFEYVGGQPT